MREVTNEVTELIENLKAKNMNGEPKMKLREMKKEEEEEEEAKRTKSQIDAEVNSGETNERKRINKFQSKAKEKEK